MAVTYYQRDIASDLAVAGANANNKLLTATGAAATLTINMDKGGIAYAAFFTEPGVPSTAGSTGNYTVTCNVAVGATSANVDVQLIRITSSGVVQQAGLYSTPQAATAGIKTFTFTALNLGTWGSNERLRVDMRFTNLATHQTDSCQIGLNTSDEYVLTPWTIAGPKPYSFSVFV